MNKIPNLSQANIEEFGLISNYEKKKIAEGSFYIILTNFYAN